MANTNEVCIYIQPAGCVRGLADHKTSYRQLPAVDDKTNVFICHQGPFMLILQANSQRLMCVRVRVCAWVGGCMRACVHGLPLLVCFLFLFFEQPQWGYIDM